MSRTVRAFLPGTPGSLRVLRDTGELPAASAYAATAELRAESGEDDPELLEYHAFTLAAQESLELLRTDPQQPRRRVVVSADVAAVPDQGALVRLLGPVRRTAVAAVHIDGARAEPAVAAVIAGEADEVDYELEWYDVSELAWLPA